jgi:hypothetical protein
MGAVAVCRWSGVRWCEHFVGNGGWHYISGCVERSPLEGTPTLQLYLAPPKNLDKAGDLCTQNKDVPSRQGTCRSQGRKLCRINKH